MDSPLNGGDAEHKVFQRRWNNALFRQQPRQGIGAPNPILPSGDLGLLQVTPSALDEHRLPSLGDATRVHQ